MYPLPGAALFETDEIWNILNAPPFTFFPRPHIPHTSSRDSHTHTTCMWHCLIPLISLPPATPTPGKHVRPLNVHLNHPLSHVSAAAWVEIDEIWNILMLLPASPPAMSPPPQPCHMDTQTLSANTPPQNRSGADKMHLHHNHHPSLKKNSKRSKGIRSIIPARAEWSRELKFPLLQRSGGSSRHFWTRR
jgi:hypothetical protein